MAQLNEVRVLVVIPEKVEMLSAEKSPIEDDDVNNVLKNRAVNFIATHDKEDAFQGADFIIIATPTDYDVETNYFNISSIEAVLQDMQTINPSAVMVITSTVPVGYTAKIKQQLNCDNIIF